MNDGKGGSPETSGNKGPSRFNPNYDPLSDMRGDLAELHRTYATSNVQEIRKKHRRKTAPSQKTHVKAGPVEKIPPRVNFLIKGLEQFQIRFKSEDFAEVDSDLRLLLAAGDSNHRVNASILNSPAEKAEYVKEIINLGQRVVITDEGFRHMINGAVERGTIYLDEEGAAQLTEQGLEAIETADSVQHAFRGQGFNFD